MSIITTFISRNHAIVFSDGRLTTDNSLVRDDFDKTHSLFNGQLLSAFCGLIILDDPSGNQTNVGEIMEQMSNINLKSTIDEFITNVVSSVKKCLENTHPTTQRHIIIHFVRRIDDFSGNFEFRRYLLTSNLVDQTIVIACESIITSNYFRVDGDDLAYPIVASEMNGKPIIDSENEIIDRIKNAFSLGVQSSSTNKAGIKNCGNGFYYKSLL